MDIRKTASYPTALPPIPRRSRSEAADHRVEPNAAELSGGSGRAQSPETQISRAVRPASYSAEGGTRYRTQDDAARIQRQTALSAKAQQALQAYQSHERLAHLESRTALNQALGVDYYA